MAKPKVNPEASQNIDAYLATVSEEQRPMLELIRNTVNGIDDRIQENWKWSAPCFNMDGLICWFIAFKNHVGLNFFKGALIKDTHKVFIDIIEAEKGNRMIHFKTIEEVNVEVINDYLKQAIALNEQNIKVQIVKKKNTETPDFLYDALSKNEAAKAIYDNFTVAQRRDYIEWLVVAKHEETRNRRMAQAIEWIAEGKTRNWKYMNC